MTEAQSIQRTGPSRRHPQRENRKGPSSSTTHTQTQLTQLPNVYPDVATNLVNFGTVRRMEYLRPPATKEGKRERNMVAVVTRGGDRFRFEGYQTDERKMQNVSA